MDFDLKTPVTLTIAGSDSSGGAGIQADIKTMSANGTFAMSVITLVTAQNSHSITDIEYISPKNIKAQADAVFKDFNISGVKTGALGNVETIQAVLEIVKKYEPDNLVIDPVMISKSGKSLIKSDAVGVLKELFSYATLITPNTVEAEELSGQRITTLDDQKEVAKELHDMFGCAVLIKGGHLSGNTLTDVLYDGEYTLIESRRVDTKNTHGTGCTLSSAIVSNLAKGEDLIEAVEEANAYVNKTIKNSFNKDKGHGPLNHFKDVNNEW